MITNLETNLIKQYHYNKHFSAFYLQDGGEKRLTDMRRNYVTVALCIKYTEGILSNNTQKLLWFENSKMLIAV